jgi:hypothetical protein
MMHGQKAIKLPYKHITYLVNVMCQFIFITGKCVRKKIIPSTEEAEGL